MPNYEAGQNTARLPMQVNAAANGNGTAVAANALVRQIEIQKTGSGTTTVVVEGSDDGGTTWYALGYQEVDATAAPARSVSAFAVGAGAVNALLQVLDASLLLRARMAATAGAVVVNAWLLDEG